jgi:hypothetical protein
MSGLGMKSAGGSLLDMTVAVGGRRSDILTSKDVYARSETNLDALSCLQ